MRHSPKKTRGLACLLLLLATAIPLPALEQTVGLFVNDSGASVGYTLFPPKHYTKTYLINNEGNLCHSWSSSYMPGQSAYLLEDGSLLRACFMRNQVFAGGGEGGRVEQYDWDGNMTWEFDYSNDTCMQHHDIHPMPNGNVLMIAWELKTYAQSIAAGRRPDMLEDSVLWPDYVIEVDQATDSIVWHWHMWDHLIQDYDSTKANYGVVRDHPELIDINQGERMAIWSHVNSIDYNADLDQIMLSARGYSEAWVIDHSTTTAEARGHTGGNGGRGGDLLYRWGNPQVYDRGNVNDQRLYSQHDAHWIENGLPGAGNILVFNNGNGRPGTQYSSVDEFVPPVDSVGHYYLPPGEKYGPAEQLWVYRGNFYSEAISGAQRLPNGNTLVDDGVHGIFSEVTPDSALVWLYVNPVINTGPLYQGDTIPLDVRGHRYNAVFKIHRYAPDYPGLEGRDLTPQGPIERYHPAVEEETRTSGPRTRLLSSAPGVLTIADPPAEGTVELYSVAGRLLLRTTVAAGQSSLRLDLKSLPAGACLCVIRESGGGVVLRAKSVIIR